MLRTAEISPCGTYRYMLTRPIKCLGTTKDGYPRHPVRLPKSQGLEPFRGALANG